MSIDSLPYLSEAFLRQLPISTSDIVSDIERQIAAQRRGEVWCAPKAAVLPGDERFIMATLGVASEPRIVATKALVVNPRNAKRGLATLNSLVTLLDGETGLPIAVVDGNWVTERRTAGLSVVAAKRLARADFSVGGVHRLRRSGARSSGGIGRPFSIAGNSRLWSRQHQSRRSLSAGTVTWHDGGAVRHGEDCDRWCGHRSDDADVGARTYTLPRCALA